MVKIIHLPRVHNGILGLLTYFLQVIESNMSHKIKLFYNFSLCPLLVFTQLFTLAEKECSEIKSSGKEPYLVCIAFLKKNKKNNLSFRAVQFSSLHLAICKVFDKKFREKV